MSDEFKIEKDIPVPNIAGRGRTKYPFHELEVGDSLFSESISIRQAAYAFARRKGIKVTVRKTDNGYRVWRIE